MLLVVTLGSAPGADEADELAPGKILVVKPGKLARVVAKPITSFDLPDAPDNDPTVAGGSLRILDTASTAGDDVYELPAERWTALGNPAGSKGFRYRGGTGPGDPCTVVLVKATVVKAVCKGADIGLAPPLAAEAAVVLTVGAGSKRYCATFGGETKRNEAGTFKRKGVNALADMAVGGTISQDPLFVAYPTDLHLSAASPCVDAGTAAGAPAWDMDGALRDAAPDIGADER
jgi:hypothetical protein